MITRALKPAGIFLLAVALGGCSIVLQKGRQSDVEKINELSQKVDELNQAQQILQDQLAQEIRDNQVKLKMAKKGLVITFVADILFDSGKAKLRSEVFPSLDKVARVLNENLADYKVGIEGHTDNEPIKVSGWKSNWELSAARALSVLQYFVETDKVAPERLSLLAYAEYEPVADNLTQEGRHLNRRVEIVIFPKMTRVKETKEEPKENLK